MIPGELILDDKDVVCNEGLEVKKLEVVNTGDRPVQIGSHYHFAEINASVGFDRSEAYGYRLNVPAGAAVRLEPGDRREVELVAIGGDRVVFGFHDLVDGPLDPAGSREVWKGREDNWRVVSAAGDAPEKSVQNKLASKRGRVLDKSDQVKSEEEAGKHFEEIRAAERELKARKSKMAAKEAANGNTEASKNIGACNNHVPKKEN